MQGSARSPKDKLCYFFYFYKVKAQVRPRANRGRKTKQNKRTKKTPLSVTMDFSGPWLWCNTGALSLFGTRKSEISKAVLAVRMIGINENECKPSICTFAANQRISFVSAFAVRHERQTSGFLSEHLLWPLPSERRRRLPLREPTDLQNYFTEREISRRFTPGVALEPLSTSARQVCHFLPLKLQPVSLLRSVILFLSTCVYLNTKQNISV